MRATTAAYPFCSYGPEAVRAAADAGFDAAVTCGGRGVWSNPFELPRASISRKDYSLSFMLKLGDLYDPLFRQRSRTGPAPLDASGPHLDACEARARPGAVR